MSKAKAGNGGSAGTAMVVWSRASDPKANQLQVFLDGLKSGMEKLLPASITSDRLFAIVLNSVKSTPNLASCTRWSFVNALVACGKCGLYPGVRGHCFLIPRRTGPKVVGTQEKALEVNFQMGYRGYVELSYRSPLIARIESRLVRASDFFYYEYGTSGFVQHKPKRKYANKNEEAISAAYALGYIRGVNEPNWEVMEGWELDNIKRFARTDSNRMSPWNGPFAGEMARKCPMTRLFKWMPSSEEIQTAALLDETSSTGRSQPMLEEAMDIGERVMNEEYTAPADEGDNPQDREPGDDNEEGEFTTEQPPAEEGEILPPS